MVCMKDLTGYPLLYRRENNFATTHDPNNDDDDDDDDANDGNPYWKQSNTLTNNDLHIYLPYLSAIHRLSCCVLHLIVPSFASVIFLIAGSCVDSRLIVLTYRAKHPNLR